ncbi:hypothetical protein [Hufsiella ginkgonis]|uniref:Uncharacterized protein n=1 Tax=Hufsiella ginkgonis TaxID=2695274 RepID=A0A7K1XTA3_9SPHI|nr:hypothetical protein [Hufsiella ginkgonis]MXV13746.1 hypothetical protein [Hufsiella ginkgonis]
MIPIRSGKKQTEFLLSTLPINQCFFCGKNGNPIMILVKMRSPVQFKVLPIHMKGKLMLDNQNAAVSPPVSLQNAQMVE